MTQGRKPNTRPLKLLHGRSEGTDSGGRKVPETLNFVRIPPKRPEHLGEHAIELWDRIVAELPKLGLLKDIDGPSLEMACETYQRWREAVEMRQTFAKNAPGTRGIIARNSQGWTVAPWVQAEAQASKEFRQWCAEYGLTPSAEMRLAGPSSGSGQDPEANPFAGSQASSE